MSVLAENILTFLFTDIQGSTHLWELYPTQMQRALARHVELAVACIEQHQGVFVRTRGEGDSTFSVFTNSIDALNAICALQRALHSEHWPDQTPIMVRAALHTGTAIYYDGDYNSADVNRCARLRAVAHGGQTLLSQRVYDQVIADLPSGVVLKDLGLHRLKDLQQAEHVWQLIHPDLPDDFPPLTSLSKAITNLPVQTTSFIGRAAETQEIKQLLSIAPLLTLIGTGGCGKTRLSLAVGADMVENFPDGVWLVELASISDASAVPRTVAAVLGLREEPHRSPTEILLEYLRSKSLLLILDNCEHLVEVCARLSEAVLRHSSNVKVLATSREALNINGERTYRVSSLQIPVGEVLNEPEKDLAAVLLGYDAVRLFVDRVREQRPDFVLSRANAAVVARICTRLDGIPLALELAAARVRTLSVSQIDARLEDRFRLLTGGRRTALPRQQTLRALIDWSYDLLSTQEKLLLARISVFVGGWTLEAAEQVCSDESIDSRDVLDLLASLEAKSLLIVEEYEGSTRYRILETVRQYAVERLQECGETENFRDRHRDWCVALAEKAEPQLKEADQRKWLELLEAEHDNLKSALQWCVVSAQKSAAGMRLAAAVWRFWLVRGYFSTGREYLRRILSQEKAQARISERAKVLNGAGALASSQGDFAEARILLQESLDILRELGDKRAVATILGNLGNVAQNQGDLTEVNVLLQESLAIRRELNDQVGIALALNNLGILEFSRGNYHLARVMHGESLSIKRELEDKGGIAASLGNLGNVALCEGDYASARVLHEECLARFQELGDRRCFAMSLGSLGRVATEQADHERAHRLHQESLAIFEELGDRHNIAETLGSMGSVALEQGDYASAGKLFRDALTMFQELGDRRGIALVLNVLGNLARLQQEYTTARRLYLESLSVKQELKDTLGVAKSLEGTALLYLDQGKVQDAVRLWGASKVLRDSINSPMPPNEKEKCEYHLSEAASILGGEAFESAWNTGYSMTWEQSAVYAFLAHDR